MILYNGDKTKQMKGKIGIIFKSFLKIMKLRKLILIILRLSVEEMLSRRFLDMKLFSIKHFLSLSLSLSHSAKSKRNKNA